MWINEQKAEKQVTGGMFLEVNEIFDTIQGEGIFSGIPATFVRLAGCNLQCVWCDTEYTTRKTVDIGHIVANCNNELVVLTGGEPLRQQLVPLIWELSKHGHVVQIETNGTLWNEGLEETAVLFMVSPKTTKVHPHIQALINNDDGTAFIKQIVGEGSFPSQPNFKGGVPDFKCDKKYVLPLDTSDDEQNKINYKHAVDYVKVNPNSRLQLQIHKILGVR